MPITQSSNLSDQVTINPEASQASRSARLKEILCISLVGWVPRPLGIVLRRWLYCFLFGHMGRSVYIQTGAEFLNAQAMELGDGVKILRDVRLNANAPGSRLRFHKNVVLDRGVDINIGTDTGNCHLEIGESTSLGPYTCIAGPGHITIGRQCFIASHVGMYANNHIFDDPNRAIMEQGVTREGIVIEDDCWLGTGVRVLDGVVIGRGSVIGAGAVVTKSIPPYSVAVGVPARVLYKRGAKSARKKSV